MGFSNMVAVLLIGLLYHKYKQPACSNAITTHNMEGPSLVILKEETKGFKRKKIYNVTGNTTIEKERMLGKTIRDIKSWGKHFLVCFDDFYLRIHFLMFGSYMINGSKKDRVPRLSLNTRSGVMNFYTCSVKLFEGDPEEQYDWKADVMSDNWDARKAVRTLKKMQNTMICDALMDQNVFAGVGNIIKNEVLFRVRLHPETLTGNLDPKRLKQVVAEARNYSFDFYKWKKVYQLRKHWQIYKKKKCPRCGIPVVTAHTGKGRRYSFFCLNCQEKPT